MLGVKDLLPNGRTKRMIALEKAISPPPVSGGIDPDEDETEYATRTIELINGIATGSLNSTEFTDYIQTCLEDPQIAKLATKRKITEERFVRIFRMLATAGLNRELKGRNIALATLGDYTCLLYVVRAVRKGTDWQTISSELEAYWRGQRDPKTLLSQTARPAA